MFVNLIFTKLENNSCLEKQTTFINQIIFFQVLNLPFLSIWRKPMHGLREHTNSQKGPGLGFDLATF